MACNPYNPGMMKCCSACRAIHGIIEMITSKEAANYHLGDIIMGHGMISQKSPHHLLQDWSQLVNEDFRHVMKLPHLNQIDPRGGVAWRGVA